VSSAEALVDQVTKWASRRDDIVALVLIGSHARGRARRDSDIDLVLLCSEPDDYVRATGWVEAFGVAKEVVLEDWGLVRSVRVFYEHGPEVEFGIAGAEWATIPPPPGTMEVLSGGALVLLDREGSLSRLCQLAAGDRDNRSPPVNRRSSSAG
jgi:predicted nucleotidyltransferase